MLPPGRRPVRLVASLARPAVNARWQRVRRLGHGDRTYPTHRMPAGARVRLGADGVALVQVGTQDLGTGTYTVLSQIAADTLGVQVEHIQFELGDSALPHAPVSGGSMTVASAGPAVMAACEEVRDEAPRLGGRVAGEILARQHNRFRGSDRRREGWRGRAPPRDARVRRAVCRSECRRQLGVIRVSRFSTFAPAVMNAKPARSQLIGGIVFGLGMALLEETHVDGETGRLVNANVAEYLMPVNADVPDIQTILVENDELVFEPAGRQRHWRTADGRCRGRCCKRRVSCDRCACAQAADGSRMC